MTHRGPEPVSRCLGESIDRGTECVDTASAAGKVLDGLNSVGFKQRTSIGAAVPQATSLATAEFAYRRVVIERIHMGYLLPEFPRGPARQVLAFPVFAHMAPAAAAAGGAKQFFEPLIAQHEHWVGLDHEFGLLFGHAASSELFSAEQVQVIFFSGSTDTLLRMGRAKELAAPGPLAGAPVILTRLFKLRVFLVRQVLRLLRPQIYWAIPWPLRRGV